MARFQYQALDATRQLIADELEAQSASQAVAQLEARGWTVLEIRSVSSEAASPRSDDVPAVGREQAVLRRHMSRVIEQGRAIAPALHAYAEELPPGRRQRQLVAVLGTLERGDPAEAAASLQQLSTFWIPLLSAASASGDSGRVLSEFLRESQRADELRRQWWFTLAYPLFVIAIALAVLTILSFTVIPTFREMFTSFDLPLPSFTLLVLTIAESITSGRIMLIMAAILAGGYLLAKCSHLLPLSVRERFSDRFGTFFRRTTALARLAQFMADLLEANLNVSDALRIAGFAVASPRTRRATWRLATEIDTRSMFAWTPHRPFFSAIVLHALTAEMPVASRIRLLREVSQGYAQRIRGRLSWTQGIIEPIAVVLVGTVVLGTAIALFLPLVALVHGLVGF